jgi:hypothetical protein
MHWSNKREGDAAVGCFVQRCDCCEALKRARVMVENRTLGKRAMPMSVKITKAAFKRDLMMSRRIGGALCALLSIT